MAFPDNTLSSEDKQYIAKIPMASLGSANIAIKLRVELWVRWSHKYLFIMLFASSFSPGLA